MLVNKFFLCFRSSLCRSPRSCYFRKRAVAAILRRTTPQKRHSKKVNSLCFKLYCAYSISFHSSNVGEWFWSWILKDSIKVQKKKKGSCCLVFLSSTKREFRHFHVVVVQRRRRNVQKSVMHVKGCCLANLLLFCHSRCRRRRRCLSSLYFVARASMGWTRVT